MLNSINLNKTKKCNNWKKRKLIIHMKKKKKKEKLEKLNNRNNESKSYVLKWKFFRAKNFTCNISYVCRMNEKCEWIHQAHILKFQLINTWKKLKIKSIEKKLLCEIFSSFAFAFDVTFAYQLCYKKFILQSQHIKFMSKNVSENVESFKIRNIVTKYILFEIIANKKTIDWSSINR